ncbi:MAG: YihY/virulence factor BrkB family protein [Tepidisphaeraceae bacterium]
MAEAKPLPSADPQPKPGFFGAVKETYYEFSNDDVMTQAAAIAFYSGLAMAPLLTIAVWMTQTLFGDAAKEKIGSAFEQVVGHQAAAPIQDLLDPASKQAATGLTVAGIISLAILAFSASGVFGQLQAALNSIWHVEAAPGNGLMSFIRKRFLSLGMLVSIVFLLLVSLLISTILHVVGMHTGPDAALVWKIVNDVISLGLFTVLFACLFKYVPDAKITWRAVWIGSAISAALFMVGKFGLGLYLGRGSYQTSYGVAVGSFVALLVWVYYSSIIVLIGAEVTEVYARRHGHAVQPSEHAVRVIKEERIEA